ncbi:MAG: alginate lyase family protein [Pirellulales bacterium]|nr:alginate lyase family protein [Pirellulales bacterium]
MNDPQTDICHAPGRIERVLRWWYVLRYHRKSQLAMRLVTIGRRRLLRWNGGRRYRRSPRIVGRRPVIPAFERLLRAKLASSCAEGSTARASSVLQGNFEFLNQPRELPDPVDWRLESWPEAPHLWRFHLHYHDFLLDLAAEAVRRGESVWFERAWQLVCDWIEHNRLDDGRVLGDAWHPYCISRRLPAWALLWSASPPKGELARRVIASLGCQARFLEAHLERDVGGNHLLENARALVLVGAFLEGPDADRWLQTGAALLRGQLDEQILPHGEHFERSPMYHALMLDALLDVRDVAAHLRPELAQICGATAERMAGFLTAILHCDGEIPLLGDACFGESPPAKRLVARVGSGDSQAEPRDTVAIRTPAMVPSACRVGDYWTYHHGTDFLLFDAGPVGPDHLPAHAHADLLTFEASIRGKRFFVDGGVFNYQDDAMRRYCRGSAAHNVLVIDDSDQCDMWSRFRMGYRGWPRGFASGETGGFYWARARHDAYRRLGVFTVGRWMACRPGGPWFCIDWADAAGRHKLTSRLHFHPDVEAGQLGPNEIRLDAHGATYYLRALAPGEVTVKSGWYCPELGQRLRCPVVEWTATASLPLVCGWHLVWNRPEVPASLTAFAGDDTSLRWGENDGALHLQPITNAY